MARLQTKKSNMCAASSPDKSKNIWFFNHYAVTPDQSGGSRHYSIGKILASRGYRVTIFASGFNYQKREESKCTGKELFKFEMIDNIRFAWIKTVKYSKNNWRRIMNMLSYTRRCFKVYKALLEQDETEKPGIIVGSSVHPFAVWAGYKIAKRLNARFIMEVRDLWPMTLVEFRKELKYHPIVFFFGMMDKFLAKRALRIISVLPGAARYYQQYDIPENHVAWIPNGVDTRLFPSHAADVTVPGSENPFRILYTGIFGMEANLQTLLHAAKAIQDKGLNVSFILTGSGEKLAELMELKEQLGLTNVTFNKPVKKEEIPSLLASAHALWIGSRSVKNLYKYGFSFNKLFEYLAAGKPILFSIEAEYNPVEESGAGITLPPDDPTALTGAIVKLLEMPSHERLGMGQKGIEYAKKFYDFESITDKLEILLDSINNKEVLKK